MVKMDLLIQGKLAFQVPLIGFNNNLDIHSFFFVSPNGKQFSFFKSKICSSSISFLLYEKNLEHTNFLNEIEKLKQYDALDYDITLKRKRFKYCILTIPYLSYEILNYLLEAFSSVYPLRGLLLQYESFDIYHDCHFHLEDLYMLGYGQYTKSASWENGTKPNECFIGFIICAAIPNYFEEPVYDFVEFEFTDSFYLRITLSQTFESFPYLRKTIQSQMIKVIEEIPASSKNKKKWLDLWTITKNLEVYDCDLNIVDTQNWSVLWLLKALSPLLDYFQSYKLNPKVIATYKQMLSLSMLENESKQVSQVSD